MTGITARTPLRPSWSTACIYRPATSKIAASSRIQRSPTSARAASRFIPDRPFAQKRTAGRSSPPGAILAAAPHGGRRPRWRDLDMRRDRADLRVERTHRAWGRPGRPELRCDMDGARLTARDRRADLRTRIGDTGLAAGDRLVEARPDSGDTRLTAGGARPELRTARRGRHSVAVETTVARRQGRIGTDGKPLHRRERPGGRIEFPRP